MGSNGVKNYFVSQELVLEVYVDSKLASQNEGIYETECDIGFKNTLLFDTNRPSFKMFQGEFNV